MQAIKIPDINGKCLAIAKILKDLGQMSKKIQRFYNKLKILIFLNIILKFNLIQMKFNLIQMKFNLKNRKQNKGACHHLT